MPSPCLVLLSAGDVGQHPARHRPIQRRRVNHHQPSSCSAEVHQKFPSTGRLFGSKNSRFVDTRSTHTIHPACRSPSDGRTAYFRAGEAPDHFGNCFWINSGPRFGFSLQNRRLSGWSGVSSHPQFDSSTWNHFCTLWPLALRAATQAVCKYICTGGARPHAGRLGTSHSLRPFRQLSTPSLSL